MNTMLAQSLIASFKEILLLCFRLLLILVSALSFGRLHTTVENERGNDNPRLRKFLHMVKDAKRKWVPMTDTLEIDGFFMSSVGWGYLTTTITENGKHVMSNIITSKAIFESLSKNSSENSMKTIDVACPSLVWEMNWNIFNRPYYFDFSKETGDQSRVFRDIKRNYEESKTKSVVALLKGPPNTGKTFLGARIAEYYGGTLCEAFKPTIPSASLLDLHSKVSPTFDKPLIVVLSEFDTWFSQICKEPLPETARFFRRQVYDPDTLCAFMDSIGRGDYPYTIFILSTNKEDVDIPMENDPNYENPRNLSRYVRKGRVNYVARMCQEVGKNDFPDRLTEEINI